jgi:hypothetical protein
MNRVQRTFRLNQAPHPGPLPVWRGEGEAVGGRAARPSRVQGFNAARPRPTGRSALPGFMGRESWCGCGVTPERFEQFGGEIVSG